MDMTMLLILLSLQYGQGLSKHCSVDPTLIRIKNAALNKPALQISMHPTGTASKAVDGNTNPRFVDGSCMHTWWKEGLPLYQWWMVDLERVYRIDSVNITNRLHAAQRLRDFDIFVSLNGTFDDDDHMTDDSLCIHVSGGMGGGETRTFNCQTPVFGQFVQVYMETLDGRDMDICEVTVEGYQAICIRETKYSTAITKSTTTSIWLSTTTPTTPKTTSAVAATTPTKTTTTETEAMKWTTSISTSSTKPLTTSKTTRDTTIWKIASPMPTSTTSKTTAASTAVTTTTPMTTSTTLLLPGNNTTTATPTCQCVCGVSSNTTNLTREVLEELVKELAKELTVNKKETSISKRKLISVGDERQSAETIGFIGVLALCIPLLLIVSFDLINLWSFGKQGKKSVISN